jgi:hypothetical protein
MLVNGINAREPRDSGGHKARNHLRKGVAMGTTL